MRTNKYPSKCAECGALVPSNGGSLTKRGRRWVVKHLDCAKAGTARRSTRMHLAADAVAKLRNG